MGKGGLYDASTLTLPPLDGGHTAPKAKSVGVSSRRAAPSVPPLVPRGMLPLVAGSGAKLYPRNDVPLAAAATTTTTTTDDRARSRRADASTLPLLRQKLTGGTPPQRDNTLSLRLRLEEWGEAPLFEVVRDADEPSAQDAAAIVDVALVPLSEPSTGLQYKTIIEMPAAKAKKVKKRLKKLAAEQVAMQKVLRGTVPEKLAPRDVGSVSWGARRHLAMMTLTPAQSVAVELLEAARAALMAVSVTDLHGLQREVISGKDRQRRVINQPGVRQVISGVCSLLQLEPAPMTTAMGSSDSDSESDSEPRLGDCYLPVFASCLSGNPKTLINALADLSFEKDLPAYVIEAASSFVVIDEDFRTEDPLPRCYQRLVDAIRVLGDWARLWLCCYHGFHGEGLTPHAADACESFAADEFEPEPEPELEEEEEEGLCQVCFEPAQYRMSTSCNHNFCGDCIEGSLEAILAASSFPACCPSCRVEHVSNGGGPSVNAAETKVIGGEITEEALAFFSREGVIDSHLYYRCLQQTLRASNRKTAGSFFLCPGKGCTAALCTQRIRPLAVPLEKIQKGKKGFKSVQQWKAQCPCCETVICIDCHLPARRHFVPHDGSTQIRSGDIVRALDCQACRPRFEVVALDPTAPVDTNADIVVGLRHTDDGGFEVVPGEFSQHWQSLCEQHRPVQPEANETEDIEGSGQWSGLQRARSYLEGCGTDDATAEDGSLEGSVGLAGFEAPGGAWWRVDTLIGLKLALPEASETSGNEWRDATIVRTFANGHIVRWSDASEGGSAGRHRRFGVALQGRLRVPSDYDGWEHDCPLNSKRKVGSEIDKASEAMMKTDRSFRKCPNCTKWLQKSEGCDVMLCGHTSHGSVRTAIDNGGCGFQFCWSTGEECRGARYDLNGRAA